MWTIEVSNDSNKRSSWATNASYTPKQSTHFSIPNSPCTSPFHFSTKFYLSYLRKSQIPLSISPSLPYRIMESGVDLEDLAYS